MNNASVEDELANCKSELDHIAALINGLGLTSTISPYLSKYAVIRSCGSVETAFKSLIADFVSRRGKKQVKRFLHRKIRSGSANPSFANMCKFLLDFDEQWKKDFKEQLDLDPNKTSLLTSLQSLVDARNDFAHGGSPSVTITDVLRYFEDARRILEKLDNIIG
jgi:hypothetical protein